MFNSIKLNCSVAEALHKQNLKREVGHVLTPPLPRLGPSLSAYSNPRIHTHPNDLHIPTRSPSKIAQFLYLIAEISGRHLPENAATSPQRDRLRNLPKCGGWELERARRWGCAPFHKGEVLYLTLSVLKYNRLCKFLRYSHFSYSVKLCGKQDGGGSGSFDGKCITSR